uniref:O-sialoglycoprotein endopeptidase n=2 Tax=Candidatus Bipolaricaulota TaxID=67810 RepID=H5SJ60_9BACT|nr:O-sialoglycoprotein endopeptidase [uncultured Acetothermia bacterium]BAL59930.1 O-sialoglycoprotein endopeptidase [Candidatus Acetothermum autotrophicum]
MIVLGIETSHEQGGIGLSRDGRLLGELLFSAELGPGERLLPAIDSLLSLHNIERDQIELIAVALGPGSFTSLRIGLAVGKGLAQALHIPIVGVPSMAAYAERVSFLSGKICVVLPDRRDLVYSALYERALPIASEMSKTVTALRDSLAQISDLALVIGPGAERHRAVFEKTMTVAPAALNRPSGAVIAQLGARKYSQSQHDELWELEPLYVQQASPAPYTVPPMAARRTVQTKSGERSSL